MRSFIVVVALLVGAVIAGLDNSAKIVGGENAVLKAAPYMVSVHVLKDRQGVTAYAHTCGGSILF